MFTIVYWKHRIRLKKKSSHFVPHNRCLLIFSFWKQTPSWSTWSSIRKVFICSFRCTRVHFSSVGSQRQWFRVPNRNKDLHLQNSATPRVGSIELYSRLKGWRRWRELIRCCQSVIGFDSLLSFSEQPYKSRGYWIVSGTSWTHVGPMFWEEKFRRLVLLDAKFVYIGNRLGRSIQ